MPIWQALPRWKMNSYKEFEVRLIEAGMPVLGEPRDVARAGVAVLRHLLSTGGLEGEGGWVEEALATIEEVVANIPFPPSGGAWQDVRIVALAQEVRGHKFWYQCPEGPAHAAIRRLLLDYPRLGAKDAWDAAYRALFDRVYELDNDAAREGDALIATCVAMISAL